MISSNLQRSIFILIGFLSIYPYTECVHVSWRRTREIFLNNQYILFSFKDIPTATINPETIGKTCFILVRNETKMNNIFNLFSSFHLGGDFEGDILIPRLGVSETILFSLIHLEYSLILI